MQAENTVIIKNKAIILFIAKLERHIILLAGTNVENFYVAGIEFKPPCITIT